MDADAYDALHAQCLPRRSVHRAECRHHRLLHHCAQLHLRLACACAHRIARSNRRGAAGRSHRPRSGRVCRGGRMGDCGFGQTGRGTRDRHGYRARVRHRPRPVLRQNVKLCIPAAAGHSVRVNPHDHTGPDYRFRHFRRRADHPHVHRLSAVAVQLAR